MKNKQGLERKKNWEFSAGTQKLNVFRYVICTLSWKTATNQQKAPKKAFIYVVHIESNIFFFFIFS